MAVTGFESAMSYCFVFLKEVMSRMTTTILYRNSKLPKPILSGFVLSRGKNLLDDVSTVKVTDHGKWGDEMLAAHLSFHWCLGD